MVILLCSLLQARQLLLQQDRRGMELTPFNYNAIVQDSATRNPSD